MKILVDGAHNAASAQTLGNYLDSIGTNSSASSPSAARKPLTFLLALSYSAEKPPSTVLTPFLRKGDRVALVPFNEPVMDMPWVRNVLADESGSPEAETLKELVQRLVGEDGAVEVFAAPPWQGIGPAPMFFEQEYVGGLSGRMREALGWASAFPSARDNRLGSVVMAGSLYLAGDFYKFFGDVLWK